MLHIKSAKHVSDYKLFVAFDDGTSGTVDLAGALNGPVFQPLKDVETFAKVAVDPEVATVIWPNGADLAPEYLHGLMTDQQIA